MRSMTLFIPLLFLVCVGSLSTDIALASDVVVASGAGYRRVLGALKTAYTAETGRTLDTVFGNMGRVAALAQQSGHVDVIIGAEAFLKDMGLTFSATRELGRGQLVLAFPRGVTDTGVEALDDPVAQRIAIPDGNKAIFGKAALEFLISSKRFPAIADRLVEVATVPQVFSYLVTGEVDMGFMNLAHALNVADKLGGYVVVNQNGYRPVPILAGVPEDCPHPEDAADFIRFLGTPGARAILVRNGL